MVETDQMWRTNLMRLCGLAAIVAGVLRGIASVIPSTTPRIMALYFFTDVFLLFGLFMVSGMLFGIAFAGGGITVLFRGLPTHSR